MYYYIKGTVEEIHLDYIVCEANSTGYQIFVTNVSAFALYQEYKIYLTHIVREDDEQLIGFLSLEEKSIFDQLLTVKGIGVKSALGALSKVSVEQFLTFVENEDVNALKKLPSIGPKAASQIILDLKGKIKPSTFAKIHSENKTASTSLNQNQQDALNVLLSLGLKKNEITSLMITIPETLSSEDIIKEVLRKVSK